MTWKNLDALSVSRGKDDAHVIHSLIHHYSQVPPLGFCGSVQKGILPAGFAFLQNMFPVVKVKYIGKKEAMASSRHQLRIKWSRQLGNP